MSLLQPDFSSALFSRLRAATSGDWHDYIDHAFVRMLGDGALPKAAFLHYLKQDYIYLHHYARAWALGVVKAANLSETRFCAEIMHSLVHMELPLHVRICAREGFSEEMLFATREEPQNIAYTRYVLDCGQQGDFLDLLTALMPCAHGYGEIGLRLVSSSTVDNPYQEWIDTYAGDEYQAMCHAAGQLFDAAARARIGDDFESSPRWPQLCQIFATASRLESGFWQMGLDVNLKAA